MVIPILIPVFKRQPLLQSAMLLFILAGKLVCQLSVTFKRRIYFWTSIGTTTMQMLACVLLVLAINGMQSATLGVSWVIVATLIGLALLTIMQAIINFKLYPKIARYLYIHITNELCS